MSCLCLTQGGPALLLGVRPLAESQRVTVVLLVGCAEAALVPVLTVHTFLEDKRELSLENVAQMQEDPAPLPCKATPAQGVLMVGQGEDIAGPTEHQDAMRRQGLGRALELGPATCPAWAPLRGQALPPTPHPLPLSAELQVALQAGPDRDPLAPGESSLGWEALQFLTLRNHDSTRMEVPEFWGHMRHSKRECMGTVEKMELGSPGAEGVSTARTCPGGRGCQHSMHLPGQPGCSQWLERLLKWEVTGGGQMCVALPPLIKWWCSWEL